MVIAVSIGYEDSKGQLVHFLIHQEVCIYSIAFDMVSEVMNVRLIYILTLNFLF